MVLRLLRAMADAMNPDERLLTTREAAEAACRSVVTIRQWAHRQLITAYARDTRGRPLYLEQDVLLTERATRQRTASSDTPNIPVTCETPQVTYASRQ